MKSYLPISLLFFLFVFSISCKDEHTIIQDEQSAVVKNDTIALLDSLIEIDPTNDQLYFDRALYYRNQGIYPKAVSDIYNALHIDSAKVDYYLLAGELFIMMGEGTKAAALMSKGINMNPENELMYEKAIQYNFYLKHYDSALNFSKDLLEMNKYNDVAYFYRGMVFKEKEELNNAISSFQTCIEVNPTYYDAHMQLGLLYSAQKEDVALQYFKNAIAIEQDSREAYYAIAYHHQSKGDYYKAILEYKDMVLRNPKDHEAFYNIGFCYVEMDSLDKAYNNFTIATNLHPQYVGAYYMKGYVSELAGNNKDALLQYQTALKMMPNDARILEAIERVK